MKKVFLLLAVLFSVSMYSQKKVQPETQKVDENYTFVMKYDTVKCSFLYIGNDGYIVSQRGYAISAALHCNKPGIKDIPVTQQAFSEKGEAIEAKRIINIVAFDWK